MCVCICVKEATVAGVQQQQFGILKLGECLGEPQLLKLRSSVDADVPL